MPPEELESVLESFVPGDGPMVVERLGSGLVNESYRVVRGGLAYTVRVPAVQAAELGLERAWECRVLERAAAAGIAPWPERCDPERGILISRWVEGTSWTREETLSPGNIARMAGLVRRVHRLAAGAPARCMTPSDWVVHYSRPPAGRTSGASMRILEPAAAPVAGAAAAPILDEAGAQALDEAGARYLARLHALPRPSPVLCHSDLHAANLVATHRHLVLLDWEYAHVSDGFWDLAGWACNMDMDPGARGAFLRAYLGRDPVAEEAERIEVMAWLYDYVCVLWSLVYLRTRGGGAAPGVVRRRARELARRLALHAGGSAR
jgi:aminoglycoside phosphotransferase (APT) family kinase protein